MEPPPKVPPASDAGPPVRDAATVILVRRTAAAPQVLMGQLLLGLINGSFYAILSLGLAVIFGLLNIINLLPSSFAGGMR